MLKACCPAVFDIYRMYYWFIFSGSRLLLSRHNDGHYSLPLAENSPVGSEEAFFDIEPFDGTPCKAAGLNDYVFDTEKFEAMGLRESFYVLDSAAYRHAGKAEELVNWNNATRFCGYCGGEMFFTSLISKKCKHCGREIWPTLSPASIVLISRGDEVLLVQSLNFKKDFYGLVAGFVETGESFEQCIVREVHEETGLKIKNLRYFDSQPWPYPRGIMVGFFADYAGGELTLQKSELRRGGWFRYDDLPKLPEKLSIARRLIDTWLIERRMRHES